MKKRLAAYLVLVESREKSFTGKLVIDQICKIKLRGRNID